MPRSVFEGYLTDSCKECESWSDGQDGRPLGCCTRFPIMHCDAFREMYEKEEMKRMKTRWPKIEDIEFMRWTHNHTQYHSFAFGFCEAQGCCEQCVRRVRVLCKIRNWIDGIRGRIIKRHYKTNTW